MLISSLLVFGQNGLKFARVSWSKDGFFNSGDKTASFRLGGREPVSSDKLTILKKNIINLQNHGLFNSKEDLIDI